MTTDNSNGNFDEELGSFDEEFDFLDEEELELDEDSSDDYQDAVTAPPQEKAKQIAKTIQLVAGAGLAIGLGYIGYNFFTGDATEPKGPVAASSQSVSPNKAAVSSPVAEMHDTLAQSETRFNAP